MRVLYLSFYFPPSRASGVYRARATANYLAGHGWDVTVFAAPLRFLHEAVGSVDEKLAETIDPRVHVERPSLNQFVWASDIRGFGRFRRQFPSLAQVLYNGTQRIFPEHYHSWGLNAVTKALRMHARRKFDVVVATGNPFAAFAAAHVFHRLTGVPYVVDYRDAWTLDLFKDKPLYPKGHPAWAWERRVLSRASGAVFVNEALREWHAARYPALADKMMVVPNGWDPDVLAAGGSSFVPSKPLRFGYVGTITTAQPAQEMVDAFRIARAHPSLSGAVLPPAAEAPPRAENPSPSGATLELYGHLGFFRAGNRHLTQTLNVDDQGRVGGPATGVIYRGPVSKTEVAEVYANADVLVFLAGGARYVTSGKIFEYMANGKPIVSVHAPGIAAAEVLAGYPLWFNADSLDPADVAQAMIAAGKAAADLTPSTRAAAVAHAEQFTREKVLAPFEANLRSLIKRDVPGRARRAVDESGR